MMWSVYEPLTQKPYQAFPIVAASAPEAAEMFAREQCRRDSQRYELYAQGVTVLVRPCGHLHDDWTKVLVTLEHTPTFRGVPQP